MKILGLKGKQRKNEKYHSYRDEAGKIADNLLKRDFKATNVELQYILDKENKKVEGESLHRVSLSCNIKQTHKGGSIPHE